MQPTARHINESQIRSHPAVAEGHITFPVAESLPLCPGSHNLCQYLWQIGMKFFGINVGCIGDNCFMLYAECCQFITSADNIIIVEVGKVCHYARVHAAGRQKKRRSWCYWKWEILLSWHWQVSKCSEARAIPKDNWELTSHQNG